MIITIQKEGSKYHFLYEGIEKRSDTFEDKLEASKVLEKCINEWKIPSQYTAEVLNQVMAHRNLPLTLEKSENYFSTDIKAIYILMSKHAHLLRNDARNTTHKKADFRQQPFITLPEMIQDGKLIF